MGTPTANFGKSSTQTDESRLCCHPERTLALRESGAVLPKAEDPQLLIGADRPDVLGMPQPRVGQAAAMAGAWPAASIPARVKYLADNDRVCCPHGG